MITYLIIYFIITIISSAITIRVKRKIEELIPITIMGLILLVYIGGILGNLQYGLYTIVIISTVSFIYLIYKIVKEKTGIIKNIITPGAIIYGLMYLFFIWLNKGRIFGNYDEFNHWGLIIKDMYQNDNFAFERESVTLFNEYPPFTAVFQYIFLKISSVYAEDTIIIANNILYLSMVISIFKNVEWKKDLKKVIVLLPAVLLLPLIFYENFYLNILVDAMLGIFFAYTLYEWYSEDNIKMRNISVGLGCISIGLMKMSGIGIVLAIILIILGDTIIKKENVKREIITIAIILVTTVFFIFLWNIRMKQSEAVTNWNMNNISISSVKDMLTNKLPPEKEEVKKKFLNSILQKGDVTERKLTIITATMLLVVVNLVIYMNLNILKKKRYKYFSICLYMFEVIYLCYMLLVYVFLFNQEEAMAMSSFERYMGTIFLTILIFDFMVYNKEIENINFISMIIIIITIIPFLPMSTIQKKYIDKEQYKLLETNDRKTYIKVLEYKDLLTENDKLCYIDMTPYESRYSLQLVKYQMLPIKVENIYFIGNIKQELKEYSYVYIQKINDETKEEIRNELQIELKDKTMYKVKIGEEIELIEINK